MAGWLGVTVAERMSELGWIELGDKAALITPRGVQRLASLGISHDVLHSDPGKRAICKPCLDWSERKPHIAGQLDAALCAHGLSASWIRTQINSRALDVTPKGWTELHRVFGLKRPIGG